MKSQPQGKVFQAEGTANEKPEAGLRGTEEGSGWLGCGEPSGCRCVMRLESLGYMCVDHGERLVYSKCEEKVFKQDRSVI